MPERNFKQHRPLYSNTLPQELKTPRIRWKILPILWQGLKRTAMVLGFVMMFNAVMMILLLSAAPVSSISQPLPTKSVLFLEFKDGLQEVANTSPFTGSLGASSLTVRQIVDALDHAAQDEKIEGVLARMRAGGFSLAQAREVREAVKRFRESGKFAHIYSSSYGEGPGGMARYYLASAFDEIWMQPMGLVSIPGLNFEMPFMRGALDKLGIKPQFYKRKSYKTAYENFTDTQMSAENRAMLETVISDLRDELSVSIAADRAMEVRSFERLVDQALFTGPQALEAGLITHLDYGDVLLDRITLEVTGQEDPEELSMVALSKYAKRIEQAGGGDTLMGGQPKLALVYAVGAIMQSDGGRGPGLNDSGVAASSKIAPAILNASRDEDVAAIVLRVDSPGGSPVASESILRAVEKAKERGKPVIVSMGSMAASGGYWVAAYGDKIFASPSTLTGSIGVVGGKIAFQDLLKQLNVNIEGPAWGRNSGIWGIDAPFSANEERRINAMLDNVYDSFVQRVATGRGMEIDQVDAIAGGRVWTGKSALEKGLVDELGGLDDALDYAAQLSGFDSRREMQVVVLPRPKTFSEELIALLEGQVSLGDFIDTQLRVLEFLQPFAQLIARAQEPQSFMTYEDLRLQ